MHTANTAPPCGTHSQGLLRAGSVLDNSNGRWYACELCALPLHNVVNRRRPADASRRICLQALKVAHQPALCRGRHVAVATRSQAGGAWRGACAQCAQRPSGPAALAPGRTPAARSAMLTTQKCCPPRPPPLLLAVGQPVATFSVHFLLDFFFWRVMAADVCLAEADERPAQRPAHEARRVGSCAAYRRNSEFWPRQWSRSSHSKEKESTTPGRIATLGAPHAREPVRSWS